MSKSTTIEIAFTPAVKAIQTRLGSRAAYARLERRGGWPDRITPQLAAFIAERDSAYLATANAQGQPYIQHRGGPRGFLHVLDELLYLTTWGTVASVAPCPPSFSSKNATSSRRTPSPSWLYGGFRSILRIACKINELSANVNGP